VIDRIIWRSSCAMDTTVPSWFTYLDELIGRLGSLGANKALSALISESICMPNNPKDVGAWAFQRLGSIHYGSEDCGASMDLVLGPFRAWAQFTMGLKIAGPQWAWVGLNKHFQSSINHNHHSSKTAELGQNS